MEVGDDGVYHTVGVAGGYDDARASHQCVVAAAVEPRHNGAQGLGCSQCGCGAVVRRPLGQLTVPASGGYEAAYVVEAFERAHRRRAYGHHGALAGGVGQVGYEGAAHGYELAVHVVVAYALAFHGTEGAGAYVQGELAALYAAAVDGVEQRGSEVQPRRRGGHRAVDVAVHCLVIGAVGGLRAAVEVGRNRYLAHGCYDVGECHGVVIPLELYGLRTVGSYRQREASGRQGSGACQCAHLHAQVAVFPFLGVAHQALPAAAAGGGESLLVVGGSVRLQAEYLDEGAGALVEAQA